MSTPTPPPYDPPLAPARDEYTVTMRGPCRICGGDGWAVNLAWETWLEDYAEAAVHSDQAALSRLHADAVVLEREQGPQRLICWGCDGAGTVEEQVELAAAIQAACAGLPMYLPEETVRPLLAGQALAGLLADEAGRAVLRRAHHMGTTPGGGPGPWTGTGIADTVAAAAVAIADATLAALAAGAAAATGCVPGEEPAVGGVVPTCGPETPGGRPVAGNPASCRVGDDE